MPENSYYGEEPIIYTLTDEDGKQWEFELLDEMDFGDNHYYALTLASNGETGLFENRPLTVMRAVLNPDTGEEEMETVEEDEFERVGSVFMERLGVMEDALYEEDDWQDPYFSGHES